MADRPTLSKEQLDVLSQLYWMTDAFGEQCVYFRTIASRANMPEAAVAKSARELRAMGLAQFMRGLMTEDGMCAGAGYAITADGVNVMSAVIDAEVRHDL